MKKQFAQKIIFSLVIFTIIFPNIFSATFAEGASKVGWENPSKQGTPYKIQLTDTLDGQMVADVISCTGIVDGAVKAVTSFASDQLRRMVINKLLKNQEKVCAAAKKGIISGAATAVNLSLTDIFKEIKCDGDKNGAGGTKVSDPNSQQNAKDIAAETAKTERRKECLNGIATKLAKDQLAVMTKYTMNWVNSGFEGDPLYVRNIDSFMGNMSDDIMMKELNMFKGQPQYYPYGNSYYRSTILGNITNGDFKESMKQNLSNYLGSGGLGTDAANLASGASTSIADRYTNNFASGGWSGWLAFTQYPQNNYLGYTLKTTEYVANKQNTQAENTKQELAQNNGFLSQKKCVKFGVTGKAALENTEKAQAQASLASKLTIRNTVQSEMYKACKDLTSPACETLNIKFQDVDNNYRLAFDAYAAKYEKTDGAVQGQDNKECTQWETVTPGSIILGKVNTYLNSEVRQLELVNGVNGFLAGIFDSLITTLRNEGLQSLSSIDTSKGGDSYNSVLETDPATGEVTMSSGYTDKSVDLTRDLGNTFIHEEPESKFVDLGDWDAKNNVPKLYPNIGPTNTTSQITTSNLYFTVSVPGNTKLILEGYNGWAKGDRAFFDGTKWQNWKKDTADKNGVITKTSPIKNPGILQTQKDYIVASKEILSMLPSVMPAIGELDYCIPGPNPGWQSNTGEAADAFIEYSSGLSMNYNPAGGFLGSRASVEITSPDINSQSYTNFKNIFNKSSSNLWKSVMQTYPMSSIIYATRMRDLWKGKSWGGYDKKEQAMSLVTDIKTKLSNDLELFRTKYNKAINDIYGPNSLMQKEYIESEASYDLIPNPSYLKMSQEGLNITKDIVAYDDKVTELDTKYRSDIIDANTNIKKLEIIKDQVSEIILAAQKRRNEKRIEIIKKYNSDNNTNITEKQYYACAKEELVSFYEDTSIINKFNGGAERCSDGIDNDLNGKIDGDDPACKKIDPCTIGSEDPSCPKDNYDFVQPVYDTEGLMETTGSEGEQR